MKERIVIYDITKALKSRKDKGRILFFHNRDYLKRNEEINMDIKKDVEVLRKNRKNRLVDKFGNKFNLSFVLIKVFLNLKNCNRIGKKILFFPLYQYFTANDTL